MSLKAIFLKSRVDELAIVVLAPRETVANLRATRAVRWVSAAMERLPCFLAHRPFRSPAANTTRRAAAAATNAAIQPSALTSIFKPLPRVVSTRAEMILP